MGWTCPSFLFCFLLLTFLLFVCILFTAYQAYYWWQNYLTCTQNFIHRSGELHLFNHSYTRNLTSDPRNSTTLSFTSRGWGSAEDIAKSSESYMDQLQRNLAQQSLSVECTREKNYFNVKCQWHEIIRTQRRFDFQHVSSFPKCYPTVIKTYQI